MAKQTVDESVLDAQTDTLLRETIREALESGCGRSIDIPVESGVYLGFTPDPAAPADVLGHLYIYVPDLTYHQRNDELGRPYSGSAEIYDQSKTLNVLANELRQLLYDEVACDHSFTRDGAGHGGSARYATRVTAAAARLDSPRVPDDEQ